MTEVKGPLERFLASVHIVRRTGSGLPETSYYPAIHRLLDDVGGTLTPRVTPVIHLRNQGSGIPDGGLFVVRPSGPVELDDPMQATAPERGAIEVKPPDRDLAKVLGTAQVRRYVQRYGKVLLTNLREWTLLLSDPAGRNRRAETFQLAITEEEFWALVNKAKAWAPQRDQAFVDFLRRVMVHDAPLSSPQDLAWLLASHARTALTRIDGKHVSELDQLRTALSESLGLTFHDDDGERFFRSTLIQTLFYGVFSAWVLWHRSSPAPGERFRWSGAAWHLRVPMVSVLFEKIATPRTIRHLGIGEIMDWTEDILARVDREWFFARFDDARAVQYFYEPFLEHFDARLREQFGVWYTPPEVVEYMVERVDQKLRTDFGIADGFADERVVVLDPCVGTGSFLLSVLRKMRERLPPDALAAQDIKRAARTRVFGFEILPAPFVVAHLQLGLLLDQLGAPLEPEDDERAAVYLTNALTGWGEEREALTLPFREFEQEREAAEAVKRQARILVVLGNPPYYQFAGVNSAEEEGLIEPYKRGITKKHSLNDLYVRFLRVAERRVVEGTGHGIVCFITSFSYLHEPGFAQMRRVLLEEFDSITIDNLNGDSRETGKRTPDGRPDPSIFSTSLNRQGIQVGTAIGLYVRRPDHMDGRATVRYRDFWGEGKAEELVRKAKDDDPEAAYDEVQLSHLNRLAFRPGRFSANYEAWPQVTELAAEEPSLGLNENRGSVLIDPSREALSNRMRVYLDEAVGFEELAATDAEPLTRSWARFDPRTVRARLLAAGGFVESRIVRFISRPLDVQWAYVDPTGKLWNEVRKDLLPHAALGNRFLLARRRAPRLDDGAALLPATCLGDQHVLHKDACFIPTLLYPTGQPGLFDPGTPRPNLSPKAITYLSGVGVDEADQDYAELLWLHALAVAYAPEYVAQNPGGITADWPRVPLPATADALRTSAVLGRRLASLLDPLQPTPAGLPAIIGLLRRADGGAAQPALGHLRVTAQWGAVMKTGAVMPGRGKLVRRPLSGAEQAALGDSAAVLGDVYDVYLNDSTFWACVPAPVWQLKIGGFQVLKKWLSYREHGDGHPSLLGRSLTVAEAREFSGLAQRLTGVILLSRDLDANYLGLTAQARPWDGSDRPAEGQTLA